MSTVRQLIIRDLCTKMSQHLLNLVDTIAQRESPEFAGNALLGILANTVGAIPQEYWAGMMDCSPCGKEGCDCHVIKAQLMEALYALRVSHEKIFQAEHAISKKRN